MYLVNIFLSAAPEDEDAAEGHDERGDEATEKSGFAEEDASDENLQDHTELEEDEGVGQERGLENFDGEELHGEEHGAVDEEPFPMLMESRFEGDDGFAMTRGGEEEEYDEAAEDPGGDGDFGGTDHGGAFEEDRADNSEGETGGSKEERFPDGSAWCG